MRRTLALLFALAAAAGAQESAPAYLGVSVDPVHDGSRAAFEIDPALETGAVLTAVSASHAAGKAGLRPGDVIVAFDGEKIETPEDLIAAVRARRAGDKVSYRLRRGAGTISGMLTLGARPAGLEPPAPPPAMKRVERDALPDPLDRRLATIEHDLRQMRERIRLARAQGDRRPSGPMPQSLGGWIEREEKLVQSAAGAEARAYHEARLSVLREMQEAGARVPARQLDRIDRKLDEILELLRHGRE